MIICLDPGATSGVAVFSTCGGLVIATKCKPSEVLSQLKCHPWIYTTLVHEKPQIYTRGKSKGNPNLLLQLYAQALDLHVQIPHVKRTEYLPAGWKGQLPKEVHQARVLSALTAAELDRLPKCRISKTNPLGFDNNMLDAIGLGLYHTGRTGRGCTKK